MIINILTWTLPFKSGFNIYHPIIKWRKEFKKIGIQFFFFPSHLNSKIFNCDILIIDYRYFEQIIKGNYKPSGFQSNNLDFIFQLLEKAKNKNIKCVLFDTSDAAGTRCNNLIPQFDIWLKKQAFKDVTRYSRIEGENQARIWMPDDIPEIEKYKFPPIHTDNVKKLRLGWNIGLCDYNHTKQKIMEYLPINITYFAPKLFNKLKFINPDINKNFLFSYRGKISNDNIRYNYNRMLLYNTITNSFTHNRWNAILGEKIPKMKYLAELSNSKAAISPFGWGEICYRDFEIILNGSLLIKPNMEHVETFPNFYIPHTTFIPVQWDYKDLPELLDKMNKDFSPYIKIIKNSQELFEFYHQDSQTFITHFQKQVLN